MRVLGSKPAQIKPFPASDPLRAQLLGILETDYLVPYSLLMFKYFILCPQGMHSSECIHGKATTETNRVNITCWVQTLVGNFTLIITGFALELSPNHLLCRETSKHPQKSKLISERDFITSSEKRVGILKAETESQVTGHWRPRSRAHCWRVVWRGRKPLWNEERNWNSCQEVVFQTRYRWVCCDSLGDGRPSI